MYKREIFLLFFQLFYKSAHASGTRHFPRKVFSLVVHMKKKNTTQNCLKNMKYYINVWKMQNKNKKSIILGSLNWICWRDHWWVKSLYLIPSDNRFLFLMTDFTVSFNSSFIWLHLSLTLLFLTSSSLSSSSLLLQPKPIFIWNVFFSVQKHFISQIKNHDVFITFDRTVYSSE